MCVQGQFGPWPRIVTEHWQCLVSGLEGYYLKCQGLGIAPWRHSCKTDLAFLDRVSLVLLVHLFLVFSLTLKLIYFPSHLCLGVMLQLAGGWVGFLPWWMSVPHFPLKLGSSCDSARSSSLPAWVFNHIWILEDFLLSCCLLQHLEFPAEGEMQRFRCRFELG